MGLAIPTEFSDNPLTRGPVKGQGFRHTIPAGISVMAEKSDSNPARIGYDEADGWLLVEGLAMPFEETYEHPWFGQITFAPDAFSQNLEDIAAGKAHAYFAADDHRIGGLNLHAKTTVPIGEGSMRYSLSDEGLMLEAELVDDVFGRAVYRRITLGILDKLSVGVLGTNYETVENGDGEPIGLRYLECHLRETSAVAYPAFRRTWLRTAEQSLARILADTPEPEPEPQPESEIGEKTEATAEPASWLDMI